MTAALNLVRIPVNLRALASENDERAWMSRKRADQRLYEAGYDEGRALHHVVAETFGPKAIQPYRLMVAPGANHGSIYGYARLCADDLLETARAIAPPQSERILSLEKLEAKRMPQDWAEGRRIGFDVRIRPVVRLRTPLPTRRGPPIRAGAEVDAFLAEALRARPDQPPSQTSVSGMEAAGRTRETVYLDWLVARLTPGLRVDLEATRMARFERKRAQRKTEAVEGPDVVFHGTAVIEDPNAFAAKLASGVGRHKAYGYGMLLLRAPDRPAPER
ncbi:MAG: type I-E CRISPR-associated protein Cas6/Cse3/CasE [Pseudomonadota bacterium]